MHQNVAVYQCVMCCGKISFIVLVPELKLLSQKDHPDLKRKSFPAKNEFREETGNDKSQKTVRAHFKLPGINPVKKYSSLNLCYICSKHSDWLNFVSN